MQDAYDSHYREMFERSSAEYRSQPGYAALVAEAARRGFRPITLAEQMDTGSADAYSWRGGVWVALAA